MSKIHPTSVVDPGAELADDVEIGPLCYVGPHVKIGSGTRLVSHVCIMNRTTLGENNTVWPQATLGADPQDLKFKGEPATLEIGDDNEIRENVTIHIGTKNGGGFTRVGNSNLIMVGVHIAHDCIIGSHVLMANQVQLAGHVVVEDHANIGGACGVHHYVTIGQYSMVGGMARIAKDVPPFMITEGNPAKVRGVNKVLLNRHQFPEDTVENLREAYKLLFRDRTDDEDGAVTTISTNLDKLEDLCGDDGAVADLIAFVRKTMIGLHGRFRETTRPDNPKTNPVK